MRSQMLLEEGVHWQWIPAPNMQVGCKIWLDAQDLLTTQQSRKFDCEQVGLCKVFRKVSVGASELELHSSICIRRVQSVSLLDPVVDDPWCWLRVTPHPPVEVDGEEGYQWTSGQDSRAYWSQLQYLIWRRGYDWPTWKPAKFVDVLHTVGYFIITMLESLVHWDMFSENREPRRKILSRLWIGSNGYGEGVEFIGLTGKGWRWMIRRWDKEVAKWWWYEVLW